MLLKNPPYHQFKGGFSLNLHPTAIARFGLQKEKDKDD